MRPSKDEWALNLALLTAQRATCCRRQVGCVLLNARGHVLATGYNGVASGMDHCNHTEKIDITAVGASGERRFVDTYPNACPGAWSASGTNLDACQAIHAEQNALLQCRDVYQIYTAYVTTSPCITCCKLLLNTSCERIVFIDEYTHSSAKELWEGAKKVWQQLKISVYNHSESH